MSESLDNEYAVKRQYGDVIGAFKVVGETKKYYKIKEGSGFTYIEKGTGRIRGVRWGTVSYQFVSYDEAKKIVSKVNNIRLLCDMKYDDWKKVSAEILSKIIILLKEDGLCEVGND